MSTTRLMAVLVALWPLYALLWRGVGWREALAVPSSSVEVVVWAFVWESVRRHYLLFFFNFCGAECLTWHFLNILKWQLIVNFFLRQTLDFPHLNIFCFKSFDDFVILCQRILEIADQGHSRVIYDWLHTLTGQLLEANRTRWAARQRFDGAL